MINTTDIFNMPQNLKTYIYNKLIGLDVDYKPLLKQAEKFESKLKDLMQKSESMTQEQSKKRMSYVG